MQNAEIQNLQRALESGDTQKALGIYRLLDTTGKLPSLPPDTLAGLAQQLQGASMELEAARLFRMAAGKTNDTNLSSSWRFHAACLLMGPAFRPEMAMGVLRTLADEDNDGPIAQKSRQLIEFHQSGNTEGLKDVLKQEGITPPDIWDESTAQQDSSQGPAQPARIGTRLSGSKTTRLLSIAFFIGLACWLFGSFMKDRLAGVDKTYPELFSAPEQTELKDPKPLRMRRGGANLTLYPRFDYHICGLVVSVNTYAAVGLRYQDLFERDFCMIWGSNVSSGFFKAPGTSFEHHGNVCYTRWSGTLSLKGTELSNNHILTMDDDLGDELDSINRGDQICLDGKLVDVASVPGSASSAQIPGVARLHTSITRTDKGMGACEILLVENLTVIARANTPWHILSSLGFWSALASLLAIIVIFVRR